MHNGASGDMFRDKAKAYAGGRLGYAPEALRHLADRCPPARFPVAVDMGSGTGIFTAGLLEMGYETYAVEPNQSMRLLAEEGLGGLAGFHSVGACAEHTSLPDGCADIIAAASAFHWFRMEEFRKECKRLLRGRAQVFLLCNARRREDKLTIEQHELCRRLLPSFESLDHGMQYTHRAAKTFFAPGYRVESFSFDLEYGSKCFLQRCLSSSYSPRPGESGYEEYVKALEALIARHEKNGKILAGNDTVLWYGRPA